MNFPWLARFLACDEGVTTVEYAMMLAMIIIAAIGAVLNTGEVQEAVWFNTSDAIDAALNENP